MNTFNEMVEKIAAQVRSSNIIEIEDIPNIDLYLIHVKVDIWNIFDLNDIG